MTEYSITIGIDLGDAYSAVCVLDKEGDVIEERKVRTTRAALRKRFGPMKPARVAMESGTHSRWVSALLNGLGHEVLVGDARRLRMIYANEKKTDRVDAETLARVGRFDPRLLHPIHHRGPEVRQRTQLVNHIRQTVKTFGHALPACDTEQFWRKMPPLIPAELNPGVQPLFTMLTAIQRQIRDYDRQIESVSVQRYPETQRLRAIVAVARKLSVLLFRLWVDPTPYDPWYEPPQATPSTRRSPQHRLLQGRPA